LTGAFGNLGDGARASERASERRQLKEPKIFQVRVEDRARQTRDGARKGGGKGNHERVRVEREAGRSAKGGRYLCVR